MSISKQECVQDSVIFVGEKARHRPFVLDRFYMVHTRVIESYLIHMHLKSTIHLAPILSLFPYLFAKNPFAVYL